MHELFGVAIRHTTWSTERIDAGAVRGCFGLVAHDRTAARDLVAVSGQVAALGQVARGFPASVLVTAHGSRDRHGSAVHGYFIPR